MAKAKAQVEDTAVEVVQPEGIPEELAPFFQDSVEYTILDTLTITVTTPYKPGTHVLTPGEAHALNQTRKENIGNNLRNEIRKFKDGDPEAKSEDELRTLAEKIDAEYEFSIRLSQDSMSELEKTAFAVARELVRAKLAQAGVKLKDVDKDLLEQKYAEASVMPGVIEVAKQRLARKAEEAALIARLAPEAPDAGNAGEQQAAAE